MPETINDVYVRKDVFDACMDRMEMLLEKTYSAVRTEYSGVRNDLTLLRADVYSMRTAHMWGIICFWAILALAVSSILLKKYFAPSITIKDVEQMVNTAINNHLAGTRGGQAE